MEPISIRIRKLTDELRGLEHDLNTLLRPQPAGLGPDELLSRALLSDFRAAIDHVRLLLWAYAAPASRSEEVAHLLQTTRMERVSQMLGEMGQHSTSAESAPEMWNFLQRVQHIVQAAIDRQAQKPDQA